MLRSKLYLILLLSALLAAGLFSDAWLAGRHDTKKLASTLATQNVSLRRASEVEEQRDAQLASALKTIEAQKRAVKTPQEAAAAIPYVLPVLPLPVKIHFSNLAPASSPDAPTIGDRVGSSTDAATVDMGRSGHPSGQAAPNSLELAPSDATLHIPQFDLKPLYDGLQDCRESLVQSDSLKQDLADEKIRSAALAKERDAAIAAVHGGTFWTRIRREAKWFAFGVAAGAAAAAVAKAGSTSHR